MRPLLILREALATAWAAKVPSALVVVLVATMCAATLATVGRTAAAEAQLLDRLDSAGSRVLIVADTARNELITPTIVDQTALLSTSERAVGTLIPVDVVNGVIGDGGTRVPAWGIHGELPAVATLLAGRWPGPQEAIASRDALRALGMDEKAGWVTLASSTLADDWSIVGVFEAREPFDDLEAGLLYPAPTGRALDAVRVVLTSASVAPAAQAQALRLISAPSPDALSITSPVSLAALQEQVTSDLANFGRTLLLAVLGAGGLLVTVITLADVLVRRTDLGRRRALGATRGVIVALVVLRTVGPALCGAAIGTGLGIYLTARLGAAPPWEFTCGTVLLALLAAATSAVPPALYAATRDPVRVLRTP
ncbi:MAG: permease [Actinomycetales bacterium]|nr:permease [Streptomyces sp.]NLX00827.1 permease [Actinomycetales bacterium]